MKKDLTTLFTGRHYTFLPEIDSTNTYLSGILRSISMPEGSVIRAMKQNAGRGQKDTMWESEGGKNLLLSFLFYPTFISPKDIFLLNQAFALGVYDFVSKYLGKKVTIKWPNDIYWENKKISGLLVENSMNGSMISYSILGIGVNVNQEKFSAKLTNAGSFIQVKKKKYELEELFIALCSTVEARYLELKNGEFKRINDDYQAVLFNKGKWKMFEYNEKRFRGRISGVDEAGLLILEIEEGVERKFDVKEIRFV